MRFLLWDQDRARCMTLLMRHSTLAQVLSCQLHLEASLLSRYSMLITHCDQHSYPIHNTRIKMQHVIRDNSWYYSLRWIFSQAAVLATSQTCKTLAEWHSAPTKKQCNQSHHRLQVLLRRNSGSPTWLTWTNLSPIVHPRSESLWMSTRKQFGSASSVLAQRDAAATAALDQPSLGLTVLQLASFGKFMRGVCYFAPI